MNCDWRTVRKYVNMEDFNCPAPQMKSREDHESKLDPFKPLIDSWLEADKLRLASSATLQKEFINVLKTNLMDLTAVTGLLPIMSKKRRRL